MATGSELSAFLPGFHILDMVYCTLEIVVHFSFPYCRHAAS